MPRFSFPFPRPPSPDKAQLDRIEAGITALIQNDKVLVSAINNPTWLTPEAPLGSVRLTRHPGPVFPGEPHQVGHLIKGSEAATFYPPVIDVAGRVYMLIGAVQNAADDILNFGPVLESTLAAVQALAAAMQTSLINEGKLMSALSDLQDAEAGVAAAIAQAITLIQSLQTGNVADADVEAVVAQLNAAAATLNAVVTPPPAP